jgi:hypothetical protein
MTIGRFRNRALVLLVMCIGTVLATVSCSSNESQAKKVLEAYLKPLGVTEIIVDLFYTDANYPNKAYTSTTVTYNFASAEGTPQREYLGFILVREGDAWRIERNASYTKEKQQAAIYLAGGK